MIDINHLIKRYGTNFAVNDISFTVEQGEIMGFLGPNGAGKTTTLNILTGYLSATSGNAKIAGVDILDHPLEAKSHIGFLPEQPPLYLDMTVKEYLNFVYDLKKCTLNRKKHLEEICEVVRISEVFPRLIKHLSKGYRQRVGLAQALVGNPEVLIFDEPTVGLDPKQIIEIRNLIKALGHNHTIILSTHILPEVQAVCDRIVVINKGKIIADEKTENLQVAVEGERRIKAKICARPDAVLSAVKALDGVRQADLFETAGELGSVTVILTSDPRVDIRKPLFSMLAKNDWPLIGLEAMSTSLEDVFIELVDDPHRANPAGKAKGRAATPTEHHREGEE